MRWQPFEPPPTRTPRYRSRLARLHWLLSALLLLLICSAGCATPQRLGQWDGPQMLSASSDEVWTYHGDLGRKIHSPHYAIYTTVSDPELLEVLPQLMEGGLHEYQRLAPQVALTDRPMDCYIFAGRHNWDQFTKENTGPDAKIYLKIRNGGYTVSDRFVAYYIGKLSTSSVAAHEGWHQFVARHFRGRLPPFMEEGIACMFEGVTWRGDLPRWNLSINPKRAEALRKAMEDQELYPLDKLIAMHAGDVVDQSGEKIEAFYAQCWAFARFLNEAEGARYRPALQKWIAETANGTVFDPTHTHNRLFGGWNPKAVRPMLEHYLEMDFPSIERAYTAYLHKVAFDEYEMQWHS